MAYLPLTKPELCWRQSGREVYVSELLFSLPGCRARRRPLRDSLRGGLDVLSADGARAAGGQLYPADDFAPAGRAFWGAFTSLTRHKESLGRAGDGADARRRAGAGMDRDLPKMPDDADAAFFAQMLDWRSADAAFVHRVCFPPVAWAVDGIAGRLAAMAGVCWRCPSAARRWRLRWSAAAIWIRRSGRMRAAARRGALTLRDGQDVPRAQPLHRRFTAANGTKILKVPVYLLNGVHGRDRCCRVCSSAWSVSALSSEQDGEVSVEFPAAADAGFGQPDWTSCLS